jgi:multiple sugar transport system substrate-binding protein
MRKVKKGASVLLLVLLSVTSVLYGCSSKNVDSSAAQADTPNQGGTTAAGQSDTGGAKVEIVWTMSTNPSEIDWEKKMVTDFEKEHPNIKVKLLTIPWDQYDQKLTTMISSGHGPDVWNSNEAGNGFATYMKMGALLDLTTLYEGDKDSPELATMIPDLLNIYKIDGKVYGIPDNVNRTYLFYNKDLMDAAHLKYPPVDWDDQSWNWDTLLAYAQKLTDPKKQQYGFMDQDSPNSMSWEFGGDFFKPEAYQTAVMGEPDLMNPKNVQAIQYHVDLINKYKVSPSAQTLSAMSQVGDPFMTGKVAMSITGGWGFGAYEKASFKWGVAAVPYHEGRKVPLYVNPWNICKTSKHPKEAFEFIKFLVDPRQGGKERIEMTGVSPVTSTLAEEFNKNISKRVGMTTEEVQQVNEGAVKYGRESDNHLIAKYASIMTTVDQTMSAVWDGNKSVEVGLKEVDKNLRSLNLQ